MDLSQDDIVMLNPIMNAKSSTVLASDGKSEESPETHKTETKHASESAIKTNQPIFHTKVMTFPSLKSRENNERERTKRRMSPRGQIITGVTINLHPHLNTTVDQ